MIKHYISAGVLWALWVVVRGIPWLLGFFVVPIALLFRTETPADIKPYPERKNVHLPKIFWLWDNDAEGAMSWMPEWPEMCWNGNPDSFLSMFQWLAIRNPANNMRFVKYLAVFIPDAKDFELLAGVEYVEDKTDARGFQFQRCTMHGFPYYSFRWVGEKYYAEIGHKIEPRHFHPDYLLDLPERKKWKGMTFRFNRKRDNSKYQVNQNRESGFFTPGDN